MGGICGQIFILLFINFIIFFFYFFFIFLQLSLKGQTLLHPADRDRGCSFLPAGGATVSSWALSIIYFFIYFNRSLTAEPSLLRAERGLAAAGTQWESASHPVVEGEEGGNNSPES